MKNGPPSDSTFWNSGNCLLPPQQSCDALLSSLLKAQVWEERLHSGVHARFQWSCFFDVPAQDLEGVDIDHLVVRWTTHMKTRRREARRRQGRACTLLRADIRHTCLPCLFIFCSSRASRSQGLKQTNISFSFVWCNQRVQFHWCPQKVFSSACIAKKAPFLQFLANRDS